ncbi:hypothetical protein MSB04_08060 [bacterium]|nr:hypothetical protein [bacterium]
MAERWGRAWGTHKKCESDTLRKLWEKYSRKYEYAKDIFFGYLPNDDSYNFHGKNGIYY